MDEIITKRTIYNSGKVEQTTCAIKVPERITGDETYDYNCYLTEDDNYINLKEITITLLVNKTPIVVEFFKERVTLGTILNY